MKNDTNSIVRYAPCSRGEIIALLYNLVAQKKSIEQISPEDAEKLVHEKLGDARTLGGGIVPSQEGYLDEINGVPLNVWCYVGAIDVSGYPHGDGKVLIRSFIGKRMSESIGQKAQSAKWEPIES